MKIVEVWKNQSGSNLKILVQDETKEYLAFIGEDGFYIINLGEDRSMEELMKVQEFVKEFIRECLGESLKPLVT